ncbi:MAG TPA: GNAT family N-acetyltransferase [Kofleriaceae bacterium]|jgi:N-acetylglutamate synthase-like GNAT family acetyltransferase|nr:GNAT family N-acetyltransferase [Kofleriaceae bacterium]
MGNLATALLSKRLDGISPSVRRAQPADVAALTRMINRAFQVEAFFVDGERTGEREVRSLAELGHFLVLDAGGELAAAVYVRIDAEAGVGVIAMLAVAPEVQGLGLGTRLIAVAEALCTALGCTATRLDIVNLRAELGPWCRRRGYLEVGTAPYDHRPVKRACHVVRMQKALPGC